jgi:hypothetical protein
MFHRRRTLAQLREELQAIELFDRVHDFSTHADAVSDAAYAGRQTRRNQVISEIEKLKLSKPEWRNSGRISAAVAFGCAIGWGMFFLYLLK